MSKRQPPKKTDPPIPLAELGDGIDPESLSTLLPDEALTENDFGDFFGDGDQDIKVELYRTAPAYWGGQEITGFLCRLNPGSDIQFIQSTYGGGRYQIKKRISGRFVDQRSLRIAGPPKLESPPQPVPTANEPTGRPDLKIDTSVGQIPIGGSDQEFGRILERIAVIRAAFPEPQHPQDINAVLLQHILNGATGKGGDLTHQIETIEAITELGAKLAGKMSDRPTDFMDIAGKAVEAFGKLVEARSSVRSIGPAPLPHRRVLPAPTPAAQPVDNRIEAGHEPIETGAPTEPVTTQTEQKPMNTKQLASHAAANIVSSFLADPPLTVEETKELLDFILEGVTPEIKAQIKSFKPVLKNMARLQFEGQVDPENISAESGKFLLFFDNVFDTFVA